MQFHTDPLIVEDLVVAGGDGGASFLLGLERDTGKARWKYEVTPGLGADVQRIGSNVYAVTLQDELLCLDWKTGTLVWKFATGRPSDRSDRNSTPAVQGNRIFFAGLDGTVYALDAYSGEVIWKRELSGRASTSVILGAESLYLGTIDRHLYRLDPKSGTVTADFRSEEAPTGRLLFTQNSLVAFFGEAKLASLDDSFKGVRWSETTHGPWSSSKPYAWDHGVLVGNTNGQVFALKASDGLPLWSEKFDGVIRGIGSSEGTLYIGTLQGKIYAWRTPA